MRCSCTCFFTHELPPSILNWNGTTYYTCYAPKLSLNELGFEQITAIKSIFGRVFSEGGKKRREELLGFFAFH